MSKISPTGPSSPEELEVYKQDFARGYKVIKEASEEYYTTTEEHKKAQLQKSMGEAIKAMNEILNNVLHEKGEKYEKKISADYKNFIKDTTPKNMERLHSDIEDIEKIL